MATKKSTKKATKKVTKENIDDVAVEETIESKDVQFTKGPLGKFSDLIKQNIDNPRVLSHIATNISAEYMTLSEHRVKLKVAYAQFYKDIAQSDERSGLKKKSDKYIESLFLCTTNGQNYYKVKTQMRSMELMLSTIKDRLYTANNEAKNNL